MHHYTDGGLKNVWLANGYTIKGTPFGEAVAIHDLDGLTRAICLALTEKEGLLTGAEFRYIRQAGMAVSQPVLGKMLGVARTVAAQLGVAERGYRTVLNTGDDGGQSVHHLHVHVLGGRPMRWPPG